MIKGENSTNDEQKKITVTMRNKQHMKYESESNINWINGNISSTMSLQLIDFFDFALVLHFIQNEFPVRNGEFIVFMNFLSKIF